MRITIGNLRKILRESATTIQVDHTLEDPMELLQSLAKYGIFVMVETMTGPGSGGHMPIITLSGDREDIRTWVREEYCGGEAAWGSSPKNLASLEAEVRMWMGEE